MHLDGVAVNALSLTSTCHHRDGQSVQHDDIHANPFIGRLQ